MKRSAKFLTLAMMLVAVLPLAAQTGCANSPENPTLVLAVIGGTGALFSTVRAKIRKRRDKSRR